MEVAACDCRGVLERGGVRCGAGGTTVWRAPVCVVSVPAGLYVRSVLVPPSGREAQSLGEAVVDPFAGYTGSP